MGIISSAQSEKSILLELQSVNSQFEKNRQINANEALVSASTRKLEMLQKEVHNRIL